MERKKGGKEERGGEGKGEEGMGEEKRRVRYKPPQKKGFWKDKYIFSLRG